MYIKFEAEDGIVYHTVQIDTSDFPDSTAADRLVSDTIETDRFRENWDLTGNERQDELNEIDALFAILTK